MKNFGRCFDKKWVWPLCMILLISMPLRAADEENGDNLGAHRLPIKRDASEITAASSKGDESKNSFDVPEEFVLGSSLLLKHPSGTDPRLKRRRMVRVSPSVRSTKEIKSFDVLKNELNVLVGEGSFNLDKTVVALDFDGTVSQLVFGDASSPFVLAGSPEWNDLYLKEFSRALFKIGKSPEEFESIRLSAIEEYRYQVLDETLMNFLASFQGKLKQVVILSGLKCDAKKKAFLETLGMSHYIYGKSGKARALAQFLANNADDVEHIIFVDNNKAKGVVAFNTTIKREIEKQSSHFICENGITIHPFYYSKMEGLLGESKEDDVKQHKTLEEELEDIFKGLEKGSDD